MTIGEISCCGTCKHMNKRPSERKVALYEIIH